MVKDGHSDEQLVRIRAQVIALENGHAWVEVQNKGCGRCHEQGGCGGQSLTQAFCSGPKRYRVPAVAGVQVGDFVFIDFCRRSLTHGATWAYVLPLVLLFIGGMIGQAVHGEGGSMLGAGLGLLCGFGLLAYQTRRGLGKMLGQPHIAQE